ncbi:MAG: MBL fold metallo-hydrolase [Nitrospiraceae bacterium]|nr:MBL fold metallo-hydrolase [Nitrospiraceae bacterium]
MTPLKHTASAGGGKDIPSDIVRISLPTPFPVGPVNAFLIKTDPPILVDTGPRTDEAYEKLVARLNDAGVRVADLGQILVTHGHLDHIGLLRRLVGESGAQTYAHPFVVDQFADFERSARASEAFFERVMRRLGVPEELLRAALSERSRAHTFAEEVAIDHAIEEGDTVAGLEVLYVPGHSTTDLLFVDRTRRAVFLGDHLLKTITPNPLIRRPAKGTMRPQSLVEYEASLRRTRELDVDVCYPGHGGPFNGQRQVVERLLARLERRTEEVHALLDEHAVSPYELAMRMFPKTNVKILHFALSAAVGHLEVLEQRGMALSEEREGALYYRASKRTGGEGF